MIAAGFQNISTHGWRMTGGQKGAAFLCCMPEQSISTAGIPERATVESHADIPVRSEGAASSAVARAVCRRRFNRADVVEVGVRADL